MSTEGWTRVRLGDVVDLTTGFPFKSSNYVEDADAIRLVRGDNVGQGSLRWTGVKRWPLPTGHNDDYVLREHDVVLAMDRPWIEAGLKYAVLRPADLPALLVQRVARLRARTGLTQAYLTQVIGTADFTAYIRGVQTGTAIPHISGKQILDYEFALPPVAEQERIAEVLSAVDDKIDSNNQVATRCDETLLVLSNNAFRHAADAGGVEVPLSSLARFVNGRAYTKSATGTGRMVVRIAELNGGVGGSTVYNDLVVSEDNLARPGDLLFAWSGSLVAKRWFRDEAIVNQHIFKVIPQDGTPMWLLYALLEHVLPQFRRLAQDKATTMGHIQRQHLDVLVPRVKVEGVLAVCDSLWVRALAAEAESEMLKSVRDRLRRALLSSGATVRREEAA